MLFVLGYDGFHWTRYVAMFFEVAGLATPLFLYFLICYLSASFWIERKRTPISATLGVAVHLIACVLVLPSLGGSRISPAGFIAIDFLGRFAISMFPLLWLKCLIIQFQEWRRSRIVPKVQ